MKLPLETFPYVQKTFSSYVFYGPLGSQVLEWVQKGLEEEFLFSKSPPLSLLAPKKETLVCMSASSEKELKTQIEKKLSFRTLITIEKLSSKSPLLQSPAIGFIACYDVSKNFLLTVIRNLFKDADPQEIFSSISYENYLNTAKLLSITPTLSLESLVLLESDTGFFEKLHGILEGKETFWINQSDSIAFIRILTQHFMKLLSYKDGRRGFFFKDEQHFERCLKLWPNERIAETLKGLFDLEIKIKKGIL